MVTMLNNTNKAAEHNYQNNSYNRAIHSLGNVDTSDTENEFSVWKTLLTQSRLENLTGNSDENSNSSFSLENDDPESSKNNSFIEAIMRGFNLIGGAVKSAVSQIFGPSNMKENASYTNSNCGPAALEGALRSLGLSAGDENTANEDIEKLRTAMGLDPNNEETEGTDLYQLEKGAKKMGASYTKVYDENASIDKLKEESGKGNQVIVRTLNSEGGGHFLRIEKIDGDVAWVHDPLDPSGQLKPIPLDTLKTMMEEGGSHMLAIGK